MEENSKIGVIIPLYNKEVYIERCLDSIVKQQFSDMEILVVNDGSTDNSVEIVKKYIQKDKRIKLINKKNGGLSSARNTGIEHAKSEYIMFVDADDELEDNAINTIYSKAEKDNLDVVIFDIKVLVINGTSFIWKEKAIDEEDIVSGEEFITEYLKNRGIPSVCNKLWRRSLYIDYDIRHPENISFGEDGSTVPRLMINAKRIGKINKGLYKYRKNDISLTGGGNIKAYEYIKAFNIAFDYLEKKGFKCSPASKFTYKYMYVYNLIESSTIFNKKIRENDQYIKLYQEFYNDLKDRNNKIIDVGDHRTLYRKIIIGSYRINKYLGELIKVCLNFMFLITKYVIYRR